MKRSFDAVLTQINKYPDLDGKTVIITGATSGIGFSLAQIVLMKHGRLVMAVRNLQKAAKSKDELLKINSSAQIEIEHLDQSSFESIKEFVTNVKFKYPDFYALVINAGVFNAEKGLVLENGYPVVSGTNLFGPVYLCKELEKIMDSIREHKIIFQGSVASRMRKFEDFEKDFLDPYMPKFRQYNMSKFGITNMFRHFSMNAKPNFVYCLAEPGASGTDIIRGYPPVFRFFAKLFMKIVFPGSLQASLPGAYLVCHHVDNASYMVPDGLFTLSGMPKKKVLKEKHLSYCLPHLILESIYGKRI